MHNHYHVVLHINQAVAQNWNNTEVIERWHQLFTGNDVSCRFIKGEPITAVEETNLNHKINQWRERLIDISWFMRILNDKIIGNDFEQLCCPRRGEYQDDTNSVLLARQIKKMTVLVGSR